MFGKSKNENDANKEQESLNPFAENKETKEQNEEICPEEDMTTVSLEKFNLLKQEYDKLKSDCESKETQYIRLAADFDNFRKRNEQERENLLKYGAEDTMSKILPVLDTFEMAKKSIMEMDDPEKIKESFNILHKQFMEALEKLGLKKIEAQGQKFDPNLHEAVKQTPSEDHEDQTVMEEFRCGFTLNDKVIRPTMVNVAVNE